MTRIDNAEHRAVYHLVSTGQMTPWIVGMYRRQLGALAAAGAITRDAEGAYHARPLSEAPVRRTTPPPKSTPAPVAAPAEVHPPMGTLVCKVPQEWIDILDAMGPTRSEAARTMLGRALASGSGARLRKTAG